jgi:hypothetical protein
LHLKATIAFEAMIVSAMCQAAVQLNSQLSDCTTCMNAGGSGSGFQACVSIRQGTEYCIENG